jgi:hypothetical protein
MSEYKCVPGPKTLVVEKAEDMDSAVQQFSMLINEHCQDGWDFFSLEEISVENRPGCFAGLFGAKAETRSYNMLVFKKG